MKTISKLFGLLLFLLAVFRATATPVSFSLPDQTGTNNFRVMAYFESLTNPQRSATNLFMVRSFSMALTNNPQVVSLHQGDWLFRAGTLSQVLSVPDTNGVVQASLIASNAPTYIWTNRIALISAQVLPGTGITITTNNAGQVGEYLTVGSEGGTGEFPFVTYSTNAYDIQLPFNDNYNGRYYISVRDTVTPYYDFTNANGRHFTYLDPMSAQASWALSTATNSGIGDYEVSVGGSVTPFVYWETYLDEAKNIGFICTPVLLTNTFATNGYAAFNAPPYVASTITTNLQVETWGNDSLGRAGYYPFRTVGAAIASTSNALPIFVGPGTYPGGSTDRSIRLRDNQNLIGSGIGVTIFSETASISPGHNSLLQNWSLIGTGGGSSGRIGFNSTRSATNVLIDSIRIATHSLDMFDQATRTNWTVRNSYFENWGTFIGGDFYGVETWDNCHFKGITAGAQDYATGWAAYPGSVGTLRIIGGSCIITNSGNSSIYPSACIFNASENVTVELYGPALIHTTAVASLGFNNIENAPATGWYSENGVIKLLDSIAGSGSGLTALNGSAISTGTVGVDRMHSRVVKFDSGSTSIDAPGLTGTDTSSGLRLLGWQESNSKINYISIADGVTLNIGDVDITTTGTFTGVGSGLSTLNADNLSSGTVAAARLPIGTDVQAYNANLSTYAGIAPSANVQTLLGAANFAAFSTSLGVLPLSGGTMTGEIVSTLGTITTDISALDATATWNQSGTTFRALKVNITDTSSAAGSLFADFQVASSSIARLDKSGRLYIRGGGGGHLGGLDFSTADMFIYSQGVLAIRGTTSQVSIGNSLGLSPAAPSSPDAFVSRTASGAISIGTAAGNASGTLTASGIMLAQTTEPTPGANQAGIYAADVGGTAELFAVDEAGNESQQTSHPLDMPTAFFVITNWVNVFPKVSKSIQRYAGTIEWSNDSLNTLLRQWELRGTNVMSLPLALRTQLADGLHVVESFKDYESRTGKAMTQRDWASDQAAKQDAYDLRRLELLLEHQKPIVEIVKETVGGIEFTYTNILSAVNTNIVVPPSRSIEKPAPGWLADMTIRNQGKGEKPDKKAVKPN